MFSLRIGIFESPSTSEKFHLLLYEAASHSCSMGRTVCSPTNLPYKSTKTPFTTCTFKTSNFAKYQHTIFRYIYLPIKNGILYLAPFLPNPGTVNINIPFPMDGIHLSPIPSRKSPPIQGVVGAPHPHKFEATRILIPSCASEPMGWGLTISEQSRKRDPWLLYDIPASAMCFSATFFFWGGFFKR